MVRSGGSFVHGVAAKFKMGKWGSLSLSLSVCLSVCRSLLCNCGMQWRKQKTTMLISMGIEEGAKEMLWWEGRTMQISMCLG